MTDIGADSFITEYGYKNADNASVIFVRFRETSFDDVTGALDYGIIPPHLVLAFSRIREYHFLRAWPLPWQRAITSLLITD